MATFLSPLDAVNAALEMLRDIAAFNRNLSNKLVLKIGTYTGHSIVVTLNDRLDYFGQTVNIASRVQQLADAGEIYVSEEVYNYPGVQEAVAQRRGFLYTGWGKPAFRAAGNRGGMVTQEGNIGFVSMSMSDNHKSH